jgi:osmotically-inducible protein OsmY
MRGGTMSELTDKQIRQAVLRELEWEPQVKSTEIGVSVSDGVVTLTGYVDSYSKRYHAERAALRVASVRAVANELQVKLPASSERTDGDLAKSAVRALDSYVTVPKDRIKVTVRNGWINLEGEVEWQHQREAAESAVRHLVGVKGIVNLITIKPKMASTEVKAKVEEALKRMAELDAQRIQVQTTDGKVILQGTVRAWAEREEAERAAWRAPGVREVENRIAIAA